MAGGGKEGGALWLIGIMIVAWPYAKVLCKIIVKTSIMIAVTGEPIMFALSCILPVNYKLEAYLHFQTYSSLYCQSI